MINEIGTLLLNRSSYSDSAFYIDPNFTPVNIPVSIRWIYNLLVPEDTNNYSPVELSALSNATATSFRSLISNKKQDAEDDAPDASNVIKALAVTYTSYFWGKGSASYGNYTEKTWYRNSGRTSTFLNTYPNAYTAHVRYTMGDAAITDPDGGSVTLNSSVRCGKIQITGKMRITGGTYEFQKYTQNSDPIVSVGTSESGCTCTCINTSFLEQSPGTTHREIQVLPESELTCYGVNSNAILDLDKHSGLILKYNSNLSDKIESSVYCIKSEKEVSATEIGPTIVIDNSILRLTGDVDSRITSNNSRIIITLGENNTSGAIVSDAKIIFSRGVNITIDASNIPLGSYSVFRSQLGIEGIGVENIHVISRSGVAPKISIVDGRITIALSRPREQVVLSILNMLNCVDVQEYKQAFDPRELYNLPDDNSIYSLLQFVDVPNTLNILASNKKPLYQLFSGDSYLESLFNLYSGTNEGVVKLCAVILALAYRLKQIAGI